MALNDNFAIALSSHLLIGLDDFELIKNPGQVYQELLAHSALSSSTCQTDEEANRRELIELQLPSDEISLPAETELLEANRLPNLIGTFGGAPKQPALGEPGCRVAASRFVCRCPILEIDLQRRLYCERKRRRSDLAADRCDQSLPTWFVAARRSLEMSSGPNGNGPELVEIRLPERQSQLLAFGQASRNMVAKRLQLARRIRRASARAAPGASCYARLSAAAGYAREDDHLDEYKQDGSPMGRNGENNDQHSLALYKLEEMLREVTVNLGDNLSESARASARKLGLILRSGAPERLTLDPSLAEHGEPTLDIMIRAPVRTMHRSADSRVTKRLACQSGDSGIEPDTSFEGAKWLFGSLDWHVKLRSSEPIQSIVAYSISLLGRLVEECPLFTGIDPLSGQPGSQDATDCKKLFSLAELKLFACVECQKMRATIRFKWIAKCLLLAFGHDKAVSGGGGKRAYWLERELLRFESSIGRSLNPLDKSGPQGLNERLPTVDSRFNEERLLELKYLDLLALVMGQLLRRHFVEAALERWCRLFEEAQFVDNQLNPIAARQRAKLLVQLDLVEGAPSDDGPSGATNAGQLLTCSRADRQIKQAAAFVVDEIASVCAHLPRLETQLESEQIALKQAPANGNPPLGARSIFVLRQHHDDLLIGTKARLETLIDRSLPLHKLSLEESTPLADADASRRGLVASPWIDQDYLIAVELVNRFRNGAVAEMSPRLVERIIADWPRDMLELNQGSQDGTGQDQAEAEEHVNSRLRQLQLSCLQIRLLNSLESQLNCHTNIFYDFGLVMLDCKPLRRSLIRCVQRERNLLVRLNLDDLLKLMERLRLQFDEIELGLDLEAAIEDYLAEKWQAKHREQPQQQLLLTGGDNDDDDEVNLEPPFNIAAAEGDQYEAGADFVQTASEEPTDLLGALPSGQAKSEQPDDDEKFVSALTSSGNVDTAQANQQLLVLRGAANSTKSGQILAAEELAANFERRVAPLIECQLLVGRYNYLSKLLNKELEPLVDDLEVSFQGLMFLSEFVGSDQLEPSHSDLISELLARSQEFTIILSESLHGLDSARSRLIKLNDLRRQVLSKLVVEFHLLMLVVSRRRLASSALNTTAASDNGSSSAQKDESSSLGAAGLNIRQLDSIQEASDWAQKLEVRFDFLRRQNSLLAHENLLLSEARLTSVEPEDAGSEDPPAGRQLDRDEETQSRSVILDRWHLLVTAIANLWRLAEDYETQQVKWLNSDIKRIDFAQIDHTFNRFQQRLNRLRENCEQSDELQRGADLELRMVLLSNLNELQARLNQFATLRIPIFMFLTNKHLTAAHWNRLTALLEADKSRSAALTGGVGSILPQACTTLAQFLELNVDNHVAELIEMNNEAISEHQLTMFLLTEAARSAPLNAGSRKMLAEDEGTVSLWQLDVSTWLENWSDQQLIVAGSRFIEAKLAECLSSKLQERIDCSLLGSKLVTCHALAKRYLGLRYTLNLESWQKTPQDLSPSDAKVTIRSNQLLSSSALIRPALFVEFLRLFTENWIGAQIKLASKIDHYEGLVQTLTGHLDDIERLVDRVKQVHEGDLHQASIESEQMLAHLEQQTVRLELEREILATKEAQAVEQQQRALKTRDECIRQITERAIPAIRAATKALDCLDERSLRFLRCVKPSPPEPVRLVIEAVCLLRSCAVSKAADRERSDKSHKARRSPTASRHHQHLEPERHFDAVRGLIIEDYWPVASRMLIGTHSSRFISDLRRVDKKTIPASVMLLIRRRYLASSSFNVRLIEKISRECALLAKWLIAVDVFDRVINVVRPNYHAYMESEKRLSELLFEVDNRRHEIEAIGVELQQMEDSFEIKVNHKMALVDSLDQCKSQLKRMEGTRLELIKRRLASRNELARFKRRRRRLASRCLMRAAKTVYVEAMRTEEQKPMIDLLKRTLSD